MAVAGVELKTGSFHTLIMCQSVALVKRAAVVVTADTVVTAESQRLLVPRTALALPKGYKANYRKVMWKVAGLKARSNLV